MSVILASATAAVLVVFGSITLRAQTAGSGTGLRYGLPDKATLSYVSRCLHATPPRPVELYSRGGWYVTDDLREQFHERRPDIEAVAMVWRLKSLPRAVYQWNHDGEFNRDVVACVDTGGKVVRSESRYTPGDSEPDQRWIYVHTITAPSQTAKVEGAGRFTDREGRPIGRPHLTSEDQDFIAGERVYRKWTDFDFAGLVGAPGN
ncbi:MAG TPA: hypothetical protein VF126_16655 [Acidobacteriaceae bacterium]